MADELERTDLPKLDEAPLVAKDGGPSVLDLFKSKINKTFGGSVVMSSEGGRDTGTLRRFSSGILELDLSLGGGLPFSRILIDVGNESTGKTLKAIRAASSVVNYDHSTHLHKDFHKASSGAEFVPGRCLWLDAEGTFDVVWAEKNGWDPDYHVIAYPEYAEQAIDVINMSIRENLFDLIVVDSLAALIPSTELEESAEDFQVGLQARLLNKAFRKWVASLNKMTQTSPVGGPCIYCLNQFRYKVGKAAMFGDPRTLPGGQGQKYAAAIIGYTESAKYEDDKDAPQSIVKLSGHLKKNKTYPPNHEYSFKLNLKENGKGPTGHVHNEESIIERLKQYKLLTNDKGKWRFGTREFRTLTEFKDCMSREPVLMRSAWRSVVKAHCSVVV
jgi:recombination protein RecA